MIIIKMLGGYGNQLFNYALAKSFQDKGRKVRLDWSYYDVQGDANDFRMPIKNFIDIEVKEASRIDDIYCRFINKVKREPNIYIEEYDKSVDVNELLNLNNKTLVGYWQNKEIFCNVKNQLISYYSKEFEKSLNDYSKSVLKDINDVNESVAVHVRGGDYLKENNRITFGGICDKNYYENAIKKIVADRDISNLSSEKEFKIFVFTNDADYAVSILPKQYNYHYVGNSEADGFMDMYLMSRCKNLVIANSTFSWWGAYIAGNSGRIIMPQKWKNRFDRDNMVCDGWELL